VCHAPLSVRLDVLGGWGYNRLMRIAFKEWAVVVDALARGEQILILRKGGIHEGPGGFRVEHPRFLFFPTLYHQQHEKVLAAAQQRYAAIRPSLPGPDVVRVEYAAEVVAWRSLASLAVAERLRGQHIWQDTVIANRFEWGRGGEIFALAVRVSRLLCRVELPMRADYGGCKSWVELDTEVAVDGAVPVLPDAVFADRLRDFENALGRLEPSLESPLGARAGGIGQEA